MLIFLGKSCVLRDDTGGEVVNTRTKLQLRDILNK